MSKQRLDQILLRHGVINEEQIKQALMRQRSQGGRLGTHLFYYRFLSEEQLVNALGEQFGVPGVELSEVDIFGGSARKRFPSSWWKNCVSFPLPLIQTGPPFHLPCSSLTIVKRL